MTKESKIRVLAIILYLIPILLAVIITRKLNCFLLSAGLMTVLLGLSMRFIPGYIGYRKHMDKFQAPIFTVISGILLILITII